MLCAEESRRAKGLETRGNTVGLVQARGDDHWIGVVVILVVVRGNQIMDIYVGRGTGRTH